MKRPIKKLEDQLPPAISVPSIDADDTLLTLFHDLRNSLSTINFTAHLLGLKDIPSGERVQYLDVLTRNLASMELMIVALLGIARYEKKEAISGSKSGDVIRFLRDVYTDLPSFAPKECQDQLETIRQLIEGFI